VARHGEEPPATGSYAERIAALTPDKRALLLKRLSVARGASPTAGIIEPRRRETNAAPLSFGQQRLWFLDHLVPENPFYNLPGAYRVRGELDIGDLRESLNAVVSRHETLRTTFTEVDGDAVQVIAPSMAVDLPVESLEELAAAERRTRAQDLAGAEALRPFDLSLGPLLRVRLLRFAENDHVLLFNMHHIVSDGWSLGVFGHELATLYRARRTGQAAPLPTLTVQYADFAEWQRRWLQGETLEQRRTYWKSQLEGLPPVLAMATDRSRPPMLSYRGEHRSMVISRNVVDGLRALGLQAGATLFMVLLAAFQILVGRYTGRKDFALGSPTAGRTTPEIEPLIGFFVNTLVLRADLSGDPTFLELVARVKEVALGAYAHQEMPFESLVDELRPERSMSHAPLVQVMFALHNTPTRSITSPGLTLTPWRFESGIARFDLFLEMHEDESGELGASLEYNTDLFDATTATRICAHYEVLLASIVSDPNRPIRDLPMVLEEERRQVLGTWRSGDATSSRRLHLARRFESQVERTPDAIAVVSREQELSYAELNARANRLAHFLRELGIAADDPVCLFLERSPDLIVGLLGALKAGATYVPLDRDYPKQRLAVVLEDLGAPAVLTSQRLAPSLPSTGARVLCLDRCRSDIAGSSAKDLAGPLTPSSLAYVIYTSGSTGKPKGVGLSHSALDNLLQWQQRDAPVSVGHRTLQFTALGFDVSLQEIFSTIGFGGTLVLPPDGVRRDFDALIRLLEEQEINRLYLPFVALHHLAGVLDGRVPDSLTEVITAGEQLQISEPIARMFAGRRPRVLRNQYGPSESHVVSQYVLTGSPSSWPRFPPIGRPIANTQLLILDPDLNPSPVGVPGELFIGGACLARGYIERPALTAERFIPHPFAEEPGARLYRTGDRVRFLGDGEIEFLGRLDNQVKVRGYRVEPGEIENLLREHPDVADAVVAVREPRPGDRRLAAYVVSATKREIDAQALRRHLEKLVPGYMVPSAFVVLEALPLTPTGKVDRESLPPPVEPSLPGCAHVAPSTPTEIELAHIWSEVLGVQSVGIHDNFFDLGGHSLLATQVVSRARRRFETDLALRALFEAPTVAGLAALVDEAARDEAPPPAAPEITALSREARRARLTSDGVLLVPGERGIACERRSDGGARSR
jgi:amino acid adenylation domain-containing protein